MRGSGVRGSGVRGDLEVSAEGGYSEATLAHLGANKISVLLQDLACKLHRLLQLTVVNRI